MKSKTRIIDIAEKVGVSKGTVDRVLHNRSDVNEKTRKKILAAIKELGYKPNLLAKSLSSKKNIKIAVVIPQIDSNNPYWERLHIGIKKAELEINDYNAQVNIFAFKATQVQDFTNALTEVLAYEADAIVINPVFQSEANEFTFLLDQKDIPYVYIDTNLQGGNNLGYFGQDAWQSGYVAAKLLNLALPEKSNILVLKLANNKIVSNHLNKREAGFIDYFNKISTREISIDSEVIDLLIPNELNNVLEKRLNDSDKLSGIFVPGSRVYKVAEILRKKNINNIKLIGYDLIKQNTVELHHGSIDYLISQKPIEQAYKSIISIFRHLTLKEDVEKVNHSPIDIIVQENIEYYNESKW